LSHAVRHSDINGLWHGSVALLFHVVIDSLTEDGSRVVVDANLVGFAKLFHVCDVEVISVSSDFHA